ncbi:glycosyltransferase [Flavobacterium sp. RHBU_3]|uniref:glycosyltransferase n=1 Tax=Flavobacterium sp. RHBU_3 TaxID=3391184 RepID=UPI003984EE20
MPNTAIIIPCYNEELRLNFNKIQELHGSADADIYLCNDGSTDKTLQLINTFAEKLPRCFVINFEENTGKANTIFRAANQILEKGDYTHLGYFDADFSTPVSEINRMLAHVNVHPETFILGSRVQLLNYHINRKNYRHYIGRIIITIANFKLDLGIYDTQCGAKIFPVSIAREAFEKPFMTSWLFDMEIFLRLKNKDLLKKGQEFPLLEWTDVDGSKLSWKSAFKIFKELYQLSKL